MNIKEAERRLTFIREGSLEKALSFQNKALYSEPGIKLDEEYKKSYLDTYKIYRYEWADIRLRDLQVFYIEKEGGSKFIPLSKTAAYGVIKSKAERDMTGDTSDKDNDRWNVYEAYTDRLREKDFNLIHSKSRFKSLLEDLDRKGFDEEYPILIDDDNRILDGQHRAVWLAGRYGLDAKVQMLRLSILNDDKFDFFPFERVPQNSRVVIYGAGLFGESYIAQLDKTGYAVVAGLLDRNADKWNADIRRRRRIECNAPEWIGRIAGRYDYIVIASRSKKNVQEMKQLLFHLKIDKEKVVAYF